MLIRGLAGRAVWVGRFAVILASLAVILPGGAIAQSPQQDDPAIESSGEAVPGQIIVKYEEAAGLAEQATVRRQENLRKQNELDLIGAEVVEVESGSTEAAIRDLNARPDVEYAEPNFKLYSTGFDDEPRFSELWGLHNSGQSIQGSAGTANVDVNGREASARTMGSPTLVVAVIDDGVDFSHPDLAARAWRNPGETPNNGVDDDRNGLVDDVNGWDYFHDDKTVHDPGQDFHGTHVAGTIAASVDNQGVVGVAPNVRIMALKFLSDDDGDGRSTGSTSDAILAIQYARSKGVKLSNNSWGGSEFSRALKNAIDVSGSLFVASAGNGGADGIGDNNDATPSYPASYTSPNILSVAAVNNRGSLGGFSNYGRTSVDISAPGVSVLSSLPADPGNPAAVLSSVGTSGRAVTSGFGAEEIGVAARRASFFTKAFQAIGRGNQQVVLVDDDGSNFAFFPFTDVGPTVAAAIQSATGAAPQTIQVGEGDGPPLSQLSGKTVVWATGEASFSGTDESFQSIPETITPADQATLTNFLNGGGRLVITGRNALNEIEDSAFVKNTLDLNVIPDSFGSTFAGAPGTAFAGEAYVFNSPLADQFGGLSHDQISPTNSTAKTQGGYDAAPATWGYLNGTSMAAPHVTGTAALVVSRYPSLLNRSTETKKIIMDTGRPLSATSGKTVTGDMVDARAALFPRVIATNPIAANPIKTGVPRGSNVTATFSDAMNANTVVRTGTFTLKAGTTSVDATVTYSAATKRATLNPSAVLAPNTTYTVAVEGGPTGAKNTLGDPMFADKVWRFKTGA